jgi:hypothetical protein
MILCPIFFVGGYYPFIEAQASVFWYLLVFFLLELAVSGLLSLSAVVFGKKNGSTVGSGVIIILWACGGIEPNVSKITENLGGFGELLIGISPFRKSFEAAMLIELTTYSDAFDVAVEKTYSVFRINPSEFNWSLVYLVVYFFVTNILAILAILWMQDNYRYWREVNEAYLSPCYTAVMSTRCMKSLVGCTNRVLLILNNLNNKADAWVLSLKRQSHEPCEKLYDDLMKENGAIPNAICGSCKLRYAEHNHSIQQEDSGFAKQDILRVHSAVEVFKSSTNSNPLLKSQNLRSDERVADNML